MANIITGAYASAAAPVTPYRDSDGVLWILAFSEVGDYGTDGPCLLQAFKSTDSGANWSAAGGGTRSVLSRLDEDAESRRVVTRDHPAWPAQPYLYALYCSEDAELHISRYNTAAESWDQESTGDLPVTTSLDGFGNVLAWSFDWVTDGDAGGLLYNDDEGYLHTNFNRYQRVSYVPITRSSLSFGTPVRVENQPDTDIGFRAGDVRRGGGGTLHGFAAAADPEGVDPETTYQAVLRFTGAGPGAPSFDELAAAVGVPYAAFAEVRGAETYLYVVVADSAAERQRLYVGKSQTAGITFEELLSVDGAGFLWRFSVSPAADIWRAFQPDEEVQRQAYDGATLGPLSTLYAGVSPIGSISAGVYGAVFALAEDVAAQQCYFIAGFLQITGEFGIPSDEKFGITHGLEGGGDPQSCGEVELIPPGDGCGPAYTPPGPDEPDNGCPTYGYSF